MMPSMQDTAEDRVLPKDDHDLLIRLHERIIALQQQIQMFMTNSLDMSKRVESLETWRATQIGAQAVMIRNATTISALVSSIISGVLVFFLTRA